MWFYKKLLQCQFVCLIQLGEGRAAKSGRDNTSEYLIMEATFWSKFLDVHEFFIPSEVAIFLSFCLEGVGLTWFICQLAAEVYNHKVPGKPGLAAMWGLCPSRSPRPVAQARAQGIWSSPGVEPHSLPGQPDPLLDRPRRKIKIKNLKKSAEALNGSDVYKLLVHCEHVQEGYKTPECLLKMPMRKKGGRAKSSKGIKQLRNLHWLSMRRCKSILKSSPEFLCHLHGFERVIFDCYHILQNLQPGWKNLQRKWDASKMKMKEMNCREMSSELFQKFLPFHCVLSKNLYQMEPLSIHIILTFIWHEAD